MKFIITSEGLHNSSEYQDSSFNIEDSVYEVIRIVDSVALFVEDHYQRMLNSIELQGIGCQITLSEFRHQIAKLISANKQKEGNVKFVCFVSENQSKWALSFIPHSYPSGDEYKNGVKTDLFFGERTNPNVKVIQLDLRDRANEMIATNKLYEVLLVDKFGRITEGSRSNVFFVKSGTFYTAPASLILVGITRQKVIECIEKLSFNLIEKAISLEELKSFDAAFVTGTSPKILPISEIGKQQFDVRNEMVSKLMVEYDRLIDKYIASAKGS